MTYALTILVQSRANTISGGESAAPAWLQKGQIANSRSSASSSSLRSAMVSNDTSPGFSPTSRFTKPPYDKISQTTMEASPTKQGAMLLEEIMALSPTERNRMRQLLVGNDDETTMRNSDVQVGSKRKATSEVDDSEEELVARRLSTKDKKGKTAVTVTVSYSEMKNEELRELCHDRGLLIRGRKADLIARLTKYDVEEERKGRCEDIFEEQGFISPEESEKE
jgi:hypothetical protein